jgi:hypothetical protein
MHLIRDFMLPVGPVSSLFDFLTFYVLLRLLHATEPLFHDSLQHRLSDFGRLLPVHLLPNFRQGFARCRKIKSRLTAITAIEPRRDGHATCRDPLVQPPSKGQIQMFGPFAAYVVAICALLISGISALTLIYTVSHLDRPDVSSSEKRVSEKVAV